MAESSLSRPGWLDSTARTIIARTIIENNDVTTVPESIEMPESLLFKFFVWHAPYVNRRKCADYVDEYSGQSVADYNLLRAAKLRSSLCDFDRFLFVRSLSLEFI